MTCGPSNSSLGLTPRPHPSLLSDLQASSLLRPLQFTQAVLSSRQVLLSLEILKSSLWKSPELYLIQPLSLNSGIPSRTISHNMVSSRSKWPLQVPSSKKAFWPLCTLTPPTRVPHLSMARSDLTAPCRLLGPPSPLQSFFLVYFFAVVVHYERWVFFFF